MRWNLQRKGMIATVAVALVASLFAAGPAGAADSKDDLTKKRNANAAELADLRESLEGTSTALQDAYLKLETANKELPIAQATMEAAQQKYAEAQQEYQQISDSLASAESQQAQVTEELAQDERTSEDSQKSLGRLARDAMANAETADSDLMLLMGASNIDDVADNYVATQVASRTRRTIITQAQQSAGENRNRKARLELVTEQIQDLKVQSQTALDKADQAKKDSEKAKQDLDALITEQTALAADLETKKASDQAEQAKIQAENKILDDQLQKIIDEENKKAGNPVGKPGGGSGGGAPATGSGFFGAPLSSLKVNSPFGWRIHPIYGTRKLHKGVDLAAACGTPIYASAAGTVVQSGYSGGYGNRTVISHGTVSGKVTMTTYNHQSKFLVSSGQKVSKGQKIGLAGTTGASTGCHLHFEIMFNGNVTDPMPYLR
jgi:murein DD-endopeptidase MepM/ murein hydrolase activator NlpD